MNNFTIRASSFAALTILLLQVPACSSGKTKTDLGAPSVAASDAPGPAPKPAASGVKVYPTIGSIERFDSALDALIPPTAQIEKLVGGLEWAEGPVWDRKSRTLLFSDVPRNVVFEWKEGVGTRDFLLPSGYTGTASLGGESGSNGLTFDSRHRLVLCQHGDRRVAWLKPGVGFVTLAEYYLDRRLNSPNDLVYKSNGDLYFTDPPYGLEQQTYDPRKELLFSGVYICRAKGEVVLLARDLTYPNGLAFSPDEKTLYVAVSDPSRPVIMAYQVNEDGRLAAGRVFFDASLLAAGRHGLPDGLKVDEKGNLFATGPGGVLVISPVGKHLGTLNTGETVSNCAWGDDGSVLYITSDMYLCRVKTSTRGRIP